MKISNKKTTQIFTIGHSNRSFEDFISILMEFNIQIVADIRRYPSSRKFPHFNREVISNLLNERCIEYLWLEALGGRRHNGQNNKSPNTGLKSIGFRNYADYMSTIQFLTAAQKLLSVAAKEKTAIMCAEKFYWKCHRRLLSDYLCIQGIEVLHIIEADKTVTHKLTSGAVITNDSKVIYPQSKSEQKKILFDF
jgi:uncharacterized protein (DUF488 family)